MTDTKTRYAVYRIDVPSDVRYKAHIVIADGSNFTVAVCGRELPDYRWRLTGDYLAGAVPRDQCLSCFAGIVPVLIGVGDIPDHVTGLSKETIYVMSSRGQLPDPDFRINRGRNPVWYLGTITAWAKARRGRS